MDFQSVRHGATKTRTDWNSILRKNGTLNVPTTIERASVLCL